MAVKKSMRTYVTSKSDEISGNCSLESEGIGGNLRDSASVNNSTYMTANDSLRLYMTLKAGFFRNLCDSVTGNNT